MVVLGKHHHDQERSLPQPELGTTGILWHDYQINITYVDLFSIPAAQATDKLYPLLTLGLTDKQLKNMLLFNKEKCTTIDMWSEVFCKMTFIYLHMSDLFVPPQESLQDIVVSW